MSIAWATVALVTFLLPGLLFFLGLTHPERFTRERARESPLGQLAGAVLVSFFLHGLAFAVLTHLSQAAGWTALSVRMDLVLAAFELDGATGGRPAALLASSLTEHHLRILAYFAVLCGTGWLVGAAAGEAVIRGKLPFFLRHPWVYKMQMGLTSAHVLTHKRHRSRHLLYQGILEDFGLKDDGTFSYVILRQVSRTYLRLAPGAPTTDGTSTRPIQEVGGSLSFLTIEGEDIANVALARGIRPVNIDQEGVERLQALLRARGDDEATDSEGRNSILGATPLGRMTRVGWASMWGWVHLAVAWALLWAFTVHWADPVDAFLGSFLVVGPVWGLFWVLSPWTLGTE